MVTTRSGKRSISNNKKKRSPKARNSRKQRNPPTPTKSPDTTTIVANAEKAKPPPNLQVVQQPKTVKSPDLQTQPKNDETTTPPATKGQPKSTENVKPAAQPKNDEAIKPATVQAPPKNDSNAKPATVPAQPKNDENAKPAAVQQPKSVKQPKTTSTASGSNNQENNGPNDDNGKDAPQDTIGAANRNKESPTAAATVLMEITPAKKRRKTSFTDSIPVDDVGYASDDTEPMSNVKRTKGQRVCIRTPKRKLSDRGTPRRKSVKDRSGTPHPKFNRASIGGVSSPAPKSIKDRSCTPHPKLKRTTSGIGIIGTPKSVKNRSSTPHPKSFRFTSGIASMSTPRLKKSVTESNPTTPRAVSSPRVRFAQRNPTTPRSAAKSSSATFSTPRSKFSDSAPAIGNLCFLTPSLKEKTKKRGDLSTKVGRLQKTTELRKQQIQAKKLRQKELEDELEQVRGDINKLNAEQQDDRGKTARYISRMNHLDREITFDTAQSGKKKRMSSVVSFSDESSGSDSDSSGDSNAAVIHPLKRRKSSASLSGDFSVAKPSAVVY